MSTNNVPRPDGPPIYLWCRIGQKVNATRKFLKSSQIECVANFPISVSGEGVEAATDGGAEGKIRGGQEETVGDEARAEIQAVVIQKYTLFRIIS